MGKTVLFHAASLSQMIKHVILDCEDNVGFHPGDMFLVNHPYKGALHPPDFGLIAPIFHEGQRVAWIGVCCHQLDVGGMAAGGSFPEAYEVFQEGMLIPPLRVVENGEYRTDVLNTVLGMSRLPTNMNLDFRGMLAANTTAIKRLQETIDQYGIDVVLSVMDEALEVTERAMRSRIAELPDGIFRAQNFLDHDGRSNKLYRIHVSLEKKGDRLVFDFSESAAQASGFMNCTYGGLLAGVRAALLPILAYDLQWNEGGVPGDRRRRQGGLDRLGAVPCGREPGPAWRRVAGRARGHCRPVEARGEHEKLHARSASLAQRGTRLLHLSRPQPVRRKLPRGVSRPNLRRRGAPTWTTTA